MVDPNAPVPMGYNLTKTTDENGNDYYHHDPDPTFMKRRVVTTDENGNEYVHWEDI